MKKIYTFFKGSVLFASFYLLTSAAAFAQTSICGPIVQDFNNTSGSTAGFTGDLSLGTNGANGYLVEDRVIASALYTVTTPTFTLPANASYVGFGFQLDGTERVARIEASIIYRSTLNGQITTVFLAQFVPSYNPNSPIADVCRAVSLSDLPGFPAGGQYRLRFELTPNTGSGGVGQTITFDDYRTNGTLSQSPLPVTFIGFDAKKVGSAVLLTWKIAGEENVARYEVEKSDDGRTFRTISSIDRTGKDTYTYSDPSTAGTAYYRIKNVDNDGKYKYSTIARLVGGKSELVLRAFPQPAQGQLTLQHPAISGKSLISLSTADGKVVRTLAPSTGSLQTYVDLSGLQKGLYMLRFDSGDGNTQTMKVIKQ